MLAFKVLVCELLVKITESVANKLNRNNFIYKYLLFFKNYMDTSDS
ncbi:MAG: hypothetical protein TRG1_2834 [Flavobacteriaceae bacterium FS1-H7996/R]|nr:MAG: hypothetical protein TRG1_2834 [Flavobacteriaceae bacterium FS1-H7996/R]